MYPHKWKITIWTYIWLGTKELNQERALRSPLMYGKIQSNLAPSSYQIQLMMIMISSEKRNTWLGPVPMEQTLCLLKVYMCLHPEIPIEMPFNYSIWGPHIVFAFKLSLTLDWNTSLDQSYIFNDFFLEESFIFSEHRLYWKCWN